MAERFFKKDDVPFAVDTEYDHLFMYLGDRWVAISDPNVRNILRLHATEITWREALMLTGGGGGFAESDAEAVPAIRHGRLFRERPVSH